MEVVATQALVHVVSPMVQLEMHVTAALHCESLGQACVTEQQLDMMQIAQLCELMLPMPQAV